MVVGRLLDAEPALVDEMHIPHVGAVDGIAGEMAFGQVVLVIAVQVIPIHIRTGMAAGGIGPAVLAAPAGRLAERPQALGGPAGVAGQVEGDGDLAELDLALVGYAVGLAVLAGAVGDVAFIGNAVLVAVLARSVGDVAVIGDAVVVAVVVFELALIGDAVEIAVAGLAASGDIALTAGRAAIDVAVVGDAVVIAVRRAVAEDGDVGSPDVDTVAVLLDRPEGHLIQGIERGIAVVAPAVAAVAVDVVLRARAFLEHLGRGHFAGGIVGRPAGVIAGRVLARVGAGESHHGIAGLVDHD